MTARVAPGGTVQVLEPRQHPLGPRDARSQDLDGQPAVKLLIPDLVHLREPAATDEAPHAVLGSESQR